MFGEGVVNDAVAILIFKSVEKMIIASQEGEGNEDIIDTNGVEITYKEILKTCLDFVTLTLCSLLLGIGVGLISAFVFKHVKSLQHHPVLEVFLVLLFGYSSYLLAELFELSGIMTLFFCGVVMSHYSYYNISNESKLGSVISISTFAYAAEAFLFAYLGLSIFSTDSSTFSLNFTFAIIFAAVLSRLGSVFISIAIYALCKRCVIDINFKQLMLIWFSGLIRGAIAFALSLEISSEIAPHRESMISATLMMVLMTTVVLGGLMSAFAKIIGLEPEGEEEDEVSGVRESKTNRMSDIVFKNNKKSWLQRKLNLLDDKVLKPCFGGDLSKLERHKEERKIEKERRTMMTEYISSKAGRGTEGLSSVKMGLGQNGFNRNTSADVSTNGLIKKKQLDMIAEDEDDDDSQVL